MDERVKYLNRLFEHLKEKRMMWETHWEWVSFLCDPRYFGKIMNKWSAPGQISTGKFKYDNTLAIAIGRWASAIEGLTTPRNEVWHSLRFTDGAESHDAKLWAENTRDKVFSRRYGAGSNFNAANYEALRLMGIYGHSVMGIFKRPGGKLFYKTYKLQDWYIDQNANDEVDTFIRENELDDRGLVQTFGRAAVNAFLYNDENKKKHTVRTAVIPNDYYIKGSPFTKNKKYAIISWLTENNEIVEDTAMGICPLICQRYEPLPNVRDPYALSPAMLASNPQQLLNEMLRMGLRSGNNQIAPVYLGYKDNIDLRKFKPDTYVPGAMNENGQPLVQAMQMGGSIPFTLEWIQDYRNTVNSALGLDMILMLANKTKQMTAEEVRQVAQEQAIWLGPLGARRESQFSEREIELNLYYGFEDEIFEELPESLKQSAQRNDGNLIIEYESPITRAQKMNQVNADLQLISTAGMLQPFDANVGKKLNANAILENVRSVLGASAQSLNSDETVRAMVEQEIAAQEAQAQQQAMLQAAELAQKQNLEGALI